MKRACSNAKAKICARCGIPNGELRPSLFPNKFVHVACPDPKETAIKEASRVASERIEALLDRLDKLLADLPVRGAIVDHVCEAIADYRQEHLGEPLDDIAIAGVVAERSSLPKDWNNAIDALGELREAVEGAVEELEELALDNEE